MADYDVGGGPEKPAPTFTEHLWQEVTKEREARTIEVERASERLAKLQAGLDEINRIYDALFTAQQPSR